MVATGLRLSALVPDPLDINTIFPRFRFRLPHRTMVWVPGLSSSSAYIAAPCLAVLARPHPSSVLTSTSSAASLASCSLPSARLNISCGIISQTRVRCRPIALFLLHDEAKRVDTGLRHRKRYPPHETRQTHRQTCCTAAAMSEYFRLRLAAWRAN